VRVALLTPLVGDTLSHDAPGCTTVHLSAPLPEFDTPTVCDAALVPAVVVTLTGVDPLGVTESTCCASATLATRSTPQQSSRNLTARNKRGRVFITFLV
jgi:hypothetical protein